ncbi:MAG: hypothetical protein HXX10_07815 [Rhodoplanes sp.]|uniref:hypothetical protein n=1 Tax=Rhodoplanes sp. TaxID=1968906 RepID=UPI00183F0BDB|nr:hypothetical protein [Rhodoplanes sp.]NVO13928.1 hypothetical protein [Rhodoplanes sp.]
MLRLIVVLVTAPVLLASASAALAQSAPFPLPLPSTRGTDEDQKACRQDATTLCKPYLGDDMAVLSCFQSQRPKLSVSCRKVLEKYGQ